MRWLILIGLCALLAAPVAQGKRKPPLVRHPAGMVCTGGYGAPRICSRHAAYPVRLRIVFPGVIL